MNKKWMYVTVAMAVLASTVTYNTVSQSMKASAQKTKVAEDTENFTPMYKADSTTSIKGKMLNAVDFYQDVQGKVTYSYEGFKKDYDFVVQQGKKPSSYVKVVNADDQQVESEAYSDSKVNTQYYPKSNQKLERKADKMAWKQEQKAPKERHYKNSNKENIYEYRPDPSDAGDTVSALFPQSFAFWMDDFDKNYSIVGSENLLGRDATVVEGTLAGGLAQKRKATHFKFWVDTQTGILLKSIETDDAGKVVNSIEMKELVVDKGVKLDKSMLQMPVNAKDMNPHGQAEQK